MQSIYSLSGLRSLVCGASQGIGLAVAEEFARLGAEVILLARTSEKLDRAAANLGRASGQRHSFHAVDFHDRDAVKLIADKLAAKATIHILVNNSGGPAPGPAYSADPDAFLRAFEGHLIAYQTILQALLPGMKQANYGRVINILSTSVVMPIKGLGVSNTLRAAVANWSRTLADELGADGITVNNILPGMTNTERLAHLFKYRAEKTGLTVEAMEQAAIQTIPARRLGRPEEIAAAVAFLASPAASYINGVSLPVDGGRLACQ